MPEPMDIRARVRQIAKDLRRVARELRSFAGDESAHTYVERQRLGPVAAQLGREVAWVADELKAALDGPPHRDAPLVCIRVVVESGVAYRWGRAATVPVERWLAELANHAVRQLAGQIQREELSHWLYELSQGHDAPPPLDADDPRAVSYRKAAELLLSPPPRRRAKK